MKRSLPPPHHHCACPRSPPVSQGTQHSAVPKNNASSNRLNGISSSRTNRRGTRVSRIAVLRGKGSKKHQGWVRQQGYSHTQRDQGTPRRGPGPAHVHDAP